MLRTESPFGWRWSWSPGCRGSPATRKPAAELREVLAPVDSGCNREGRQRGNGKRGEAVPDRERERGQRRPVPRDRRRPEAAELELDLKLGRL